LIWVPSAGAADGHSQAGSAAFASLVRRACGRWDCVSDGLVSRFHTQVCQTLAEKIETLGENPQTPAECFPFQRGGYVGSREENAPSSLRAGRIILDGSARQQLIDRQLVELGEQSHDFASVEGGALRDLPRVFGPFSLHQLTAIAIMLIASYTAFELWRGRRTSEI
jgi:hypothetical protein